MFKANTATPSSMECICIDIKLYIQSENGVLLLRLSLRPKPKTVIFLDSSALDTRLGRSNKSERLPMRKKCKQS